VSKKIQNIKELLPYEAKVEGIEEVLH